MTVEQPQQEDLTREDVNNTIRMVRLLNVFLGDKRIPEEERKKLANLFKGVFE